MLPSPEQGIIPPRTQWTGHIIIARHTKPLPLIMLNNEMDADCRGGGPRDAPIPRFTSRLTGCRRSLLALGDGSRGEVGAAVEAPGDGVGRPRRAG